MRYGFCCVVAALVASPSLAYAEEVARNTLKESALVIEVQATLAGTGDVVARTAMGVAVSAEGYVLSTASWVFDELPEQRSIKTRIRSWKAAIPDPSFDLQIVSIDRSADLALLRVSLGTRKESQSRAPLESSQPRFRPMAIENMPAIGEEVQIASIERGSGFFIATGRVTSLQAVRTVGSLSAGAPVINQRGNLVALVSSRSSDGSYVVVPMSSAVKFLSESKIGLPLNMTEARTAQPARTDVVQISQVLAQHEMGVRNVPFERMYAAPSGYRIGEIQFLTNSANGLTSPVSVVKGADERTVAVKFELMSGPVWDQWRGWLEGELRVQLVPERSGFAPRSAHR